MLTIAKKNSNMFSIIKKRGEGNMMTSDKKEIYLTQKGLDEILEELNVLKQEKRPEIIKAIKEARALGDLSENADYHAAREEQGYIEGRIKELEYMVENAVIIEEKSSDKVKLGTTVIIKYLSDGETETYTIVGSIEADPFENKISNESPIAKAIMGKKVGAVATVESPNGKYDIEILEIK
jgi:transcription elongation factor GreA